MAGKKIKNIFKNRQKSLYMRYLSQKKDNNVSVIDLKHDLENQIVKITQRLELLQTKSNTTGSIRRKYEDVCRTNIDEVSESLTFIDRIANQMATEMVCMNILSGNNIEAYQSRQEHIIYKIIHRLLMLYENDFNHRNIIYDISPSTLKWRVNNEVLSAILLKIIQNATKYSLHDSQININISEEKINLSMTSLRIISSEKEKLFSDGYKGVNGIESGKSKTGKGLYHAKKLCDFHNLNISVEIGEKIATGRDGLDYAINSFIVSKR